MARIEDVMNFTAQSDLGIRYDVTIKPTEDSNPEFAADIAKSMEKIPRAKGLLMIMVPDDDDQGECDVITLGLSVNILAQLLLKHKDASGIANVLAAASIAEGQIRAAERLRAAMEESRKRELSDFLAAMASRVTQRKQEQEGGE